MISDLQHTKETKHSLLHIVVFVCVFNRGNAISFEFELLTFGNLFLDEHRLCFCNPKFDLFPFDWKTFGCLWDF